MPSVEHGYPAPTLVIGLGRFGLAAFERLGEDWMWVRRSGGDTTLGNLRLLHVRESEGLDANLWRERERVSHDLARYVGEGDQPSKVLDLMLLRTLGLVRYRDGIYQIAEPVDAGVVEREQDDPSPSRVTRRRYFVWRNLAADPITSADRLTEITAQHAQLDLFISPLLSRVRQGHSPATLLACIGRCRALLEGRDPSPWDWMDAHLSAAHPPEPDRSVVLELSPQWLTADDRFGYLEDLAPAPLPGWSDPAGDLRPLAVRMAPLHVPRAADPRTPLPPWRLLAVDWQQSGWASAGSRDVRLEPVAASPFRLGFFDHDQTQHLIPEGDEAQGRARLAARLRQAGEALHRGLVGLWIDISRAQVLGSAGGPEGRAREQAEESLRQSLEILAEIAVRPVAEQAAPQPVEPAQPPDDLLPARASPQLRSLLLELPEPSGAVERALEQRLAQLAGDASSGDSPFARPLLREIELVPSDLEHRLALPDPRGDNVAAGLAQLRQTVNREVRDLFDRTYLSEYRDEPTRRPPRLTVIVVGDMAEPFTRVSVTAVTQAVHAELLRAFGPIFVTYRQGMDRALNVLPILWMPHPADAFAGAPTEQSITEEAAIIDGVHGLRRWAESIPTSARCVSQIFVQGRVTDNAVLPLSDAVRQTRDFVSLLIRNPITNDGLLSRASNGTGGHDLFSSFTCYEVDFPARRAREYLANRLARDLLELLKRHEGDGPLELPEPLPPPELGEPLRHARQRIREVTEGAANHLRSFVEEQLRVEPSSDPDAIAEAFDDAFQQSLLERIQSDWSRLAQDRGIMDDHIDELRRRAHGAVAQALPALRAYADEVIERTATQGGLGAARATFNQITRRGFDELRQREGERQRRQGECVRHSIPNIAGLEAARRDVLAAAADKPRLRPMLLGALAWAMMVPAIGAPLAWALAQGLRLPARPDWREVVLGPWGPVVGGLVLLIPALLLLRRHMLRAVLRTRRAIKHLAASSAKVMDSGEEAAAPSVRSFLDTRVRLAAAVAARSYSMRVYEQQFSDRELAFRLGRSVELQQQELRRRAEDLGVRPSVTGGDDDVTYLFSRLMRTRRQPVGRDLLLGPERMLELYQANTPPAEQLALLAPFLGAVGGFARWREVACLADLEAILAFCRERFAFVAHTPVAQQASLAAEVSARLLQFVARTYPNVGFGAKFLGYEGLDPDGVSLLAHAALVAHPRLLDLYQRARQLPDAPATTETLQTIPAQVRENTAYLLSLVQDVRAHSVHNLRRFESFLDRTPAAAGDPSQLLSALEDGPLGAMSWHASLKRDVAAALGSGTSNDNE